MEKNNPNKRRIVYFVNDEEYENLQYTDDGIELLKKNEVMLVPTNKVQTFLNNYEVVDGMIPQNGTMLVMSPQNPDAYSKIESSNENFAIEKMNNILLLCYRLGAKRVEILNILEEIEKKERETSTNVKAKGNLYGGGVDTKSTQQKDLKKEIGFTDEHSGGEADYNGAMDLLKEKRLGGDTFLKNLVEMRNPKYSNNQLISRVLRLELNTDMKDTFDLAAKLKIPVGNGKFEYNEKTSSNKKYILEIKIDF